MPEKQKRKSKSGNLDNILMMIFVPVASILLLIGLIVFWRYDAEVDIRMTQQAYDEMATYVSGENMTREVQIRAIILTATAEANNTPSP